MIEEGSVNVELSSIMTVSGWKSCISSLNTCLSLIAIPFKQNSSLAESSLSTPGDKRRSLYTNNMRFNFTLNDP
jgi:hypothetical protein